MTGTQHRRRAILGAASSIGIRPYDTGEPRGLHHAPAVLRQLGVAERLAADDRGDVTPPPYRDFTRAPGSVRNEPEVEQYSRRLAERVASVIADSCFPVVLGGDCSIVLGSLLGVVRGGSRIGLAYIDAHADFATPQESQTGSAASMCLALSIGRGESPLASLAGAKPLVRAEDVALVGRRDLGQTYYGHAALETSGILDLQGERLQEDVHGAAAAVLDRVGRADLDGFWIHVDADVLDAEVMPAVDSPEPDGPGLDELSALVAPLARHPKALGIQLTIYDPVLDPDRTCASRLVTLLERVCR